MHAPIALLVQPVWPLLSDFAIKGTIILSLAMLAWLVLRRASAASRHLVWTLAMASLLLLPPCIRLLPDVSVPLLPAPQVSVPAVEVPYQGPPIPEVVGGVKFFPPAVPLPDSPREDAIKKALVMAGLSPPFAWLTLVWFVGGALVVLPWLFGHLLLVRLRARCRRIDDPEWNALASSLGAQLGLHHRVALYEAPGAAMPMAWGMLSGCVFLPASAREWPDAMRRAVLLHELAHVKRRDCATHALARLAVALYWWHPLAWYALRRMRIERERACDDLVLAAGVSPKDYANRLLDVAQSLHAPRIAAVAAITMAKQRQLEGRLLAVLDSTRNRRGLTKKMLLASLILAVGIVVGVSAVKFTHREPDIAPVASNDTSPLPPTPPPTTDPWTRTIGDMQVNMLGICQYSGQTEIWRSPTGVELEGVPAHPFHGAPPSTYSERSYAFAVEVLAPQGLTAEMLAAEDVTPSVKVDVENVGGVGSSSQPHLEKKAIPPRWVSYNAREEMPLKILESGKCTVRVGVAAGPWQETAKATWQATGDYWQGGSWASPQGAVMFAKPYEMDGEAYVVLSHTLQDVATKLIAVERDGNEISADSAMVTTLTGNLTQVEWRIQWRRLAEFKGFRLEYRPYTWVEFKDVPLRPRD